MRQNRVFVDSIVLWETVLLFGKGQQIPTGPLSSGLHSAERVSAGIDYPKNSKENDIGVLYL